MNTFTTILGCKSYFAICHILKHITNYSSFKNTINKERHYFHNQFNHSFLGLSVTSQEGTLHQALNAMQSVEKRQGIEEGIANYEKILRLLLQVQLATSETASKLEQKEDEVSTFDLLVYFYLLGVHIQ